MGSHVHSLLSFNRRHKNGLKFIGTGNRATPLQYSKLMFCSSIRNCIAYANESNIVNKDSHAGAEPGFFLRGGSPLENGVTLTGDRT